MAGILPDAVNGGLITRDSGGNCLSPAGVQNAYCPPGSFASTCPLTALPSDCTARISAAQINALVSEMLCLASTMNPNGTWNCTSVCNMASAFQAWSDDTGVSDNVTITGDGTTLSPYEIIPAGVAAAICASDEAADILAACLISTDLNNAIEIGTDGRLLASDQQPRQGMSAPVGAPPANTSRLYFDDTANLLYYWDGATWNPVGPPTQAFTGQLTGTTSTQFQAGVVAPGPVGAPSVVVTNIVNPSPTRPLLVTVFVSSYVSGNNIVSGSFGYNVDFDNGGGGGFAGVSTTGLAGPFTDAASALYGSSANTISFTIPAGGNRNVSLRGQVIAGNNSNNQMTGVGVTAGSNAFYTAVVV